MTMLLLLLLMPMLAEQLKSTVDNLSKPHGVQSLSGCRGYASIVEWSGTGKGRAALESEWEIVRDKGRDQRRVCLLV